LQTGDPKAEVGLELKVISACVLGGVALTGGRGTIMAIIWGMLIMGAVQRAMDLNQVGIYWQFLISGGILLTAVIVDRLKSKLA
jgi:L-arabinose transport system permease protein